MEIKSYLKIIFGKWRIIEIALAVTIAATLGFTWLQAPTYEAQNRFVLRPKSSVIREDEDFLRALDTLSNREEINATIAEVANSDLIKSRAAQQINVSPREARAFNVEARVRGGTNILEITVRGPSAQLTHDFLNAISIETSRYHNEIYGIFQLEVLDRAEVPTDPVRPNKPLNMALGGILGLVLGIGLAFYSHYIETPDKESTFFNVLDHQTNIFNRDYFLFRLQQEISRSARNEYPLSLVSIHLTSEDKSPTYQEWLETAGMRQAAEMVEKELREEDIPARIGPRTLAVLVPDLEKDDIQNIVENFQIKFTETVGKNPFRLKQQRISGKVRVKTYSGEENLDAEEFLTHAIQPPPAPEEGERAEEEKEWFET